MRCESEPRATFGLRAHALAAAGFIVLAVVSTWPAARETGAIPLGRQAGAVPLFNLWTFAWNADRIERGCAGYFQAPIFHPTADAFAFSEPQPPTALLWPLFRLFDAPALPYQAYLLTALFLNGWATYALLRSLSCGWTSAVFGGAAVEVLPLVHWESGVVQIVPLFAAIWTIHALWNFGERPTTGRALLAGGSFALAYLLCGYKGLFLAVLLVACGWWLIGRRALEASAWLRLGAGAALSATLLLPVVWTQYRASQEHEWRRDRQLVQGLSAHAVDFTVVAYSRGVDWPDLSHEPRRRFYKLNPGWLKCGLALLGLVSGLIARDRRRWTLFCLALLAASFAVSLGPRLQLFGFAPWSWMSDHVPGFAAIRTVYRMAIFSQLAVALLAAGGIDWCVRSRLPGRILKRVGRLVVRRRAEHADAAATCTGSRGSVAVAGLLALAAIGECFPGPQKMYVVPRAADHAGWIDWLRTNTPEEAVIAHVPFPAGSSPAAYVPTVEWMYLGLWHGRRTVNGYSGFFPKSYLKLKQTMQSFPDETSLDRLAECGVVWCLVDPQRLEPEVQRRIDGENRLELAFVDNATGMRIYRLR